MSEENENEILDDENLDDEDVVEEESDEAEESTEENSTNEGDDKEEEDKSNSKEWKNDLNKYYAELRREKEASEKLAKEKEEKLAKVTSVTENKFTGEPLNPDEIETYMEMLECEKEGLDPTSTVDFLKFQNQKKAKALQEESLKKAQEEQLAQATQERVNTEVKELIEAYPELKNEKEWNKLNNDSSWLLFSDGKLGGSKSLKEVYEQYQNFMNKTVQSRVVKEVAKRESTPPSPSATSDGNVEITAEELAGMSRAEIEANYSRIFPKK